MGTPVYDRGVTLAMTALTVGHRVIDKVSGGRVGRRLGPGVPAVWLTTTGRRSGRLRRTPLVAARDGEAFLVAGSAGGRERGPAWVHNLRDHERRTEPVGLQDGESHHQADVSELLGADRERGFEKMVSVYSGFASYQRHTDRTIPVFRLMPRSQSP